MSDISLGASFSLIYLRVLVKVLLGKRIHDSFKCAQIMDGLLRNKKAQSSGNPRTGTMV